MFLAFQDTANRYQKFLYPWKQRLRGDMGVIQLLWGWLVRLHTMLPVCGANYFTFSDAIKKLCMDHLHKVKMFQTHFYAQGTELCVSKQQLVHYQSHSVTMLNFPQCFVGNIMCHYCWQCFCTAVSVIVRYICTMSVRHGLVC